MVITVTFEQRPERNEGTSYKNIFEKKILRREKNVFKGAEAGAWQVQEIAKKSC